MVTEDARDCIDEHTLAVGALAIQKHENMFFGMAGHAVAEEALQEVDQLGIVVSHTIRKSSQSGKGVPGFAAATAATLVM